MLCPGGYDQTPWASAYGRVRVPTSGSTGCRRRRRGARPAALLIDFAGGARVLLHQALEDLDPVVPEEDIDRVHPEGAPNPRVGGTGTARLFAERA